MTSSGKSIVLESLQNALQKTAAESVNPSDALLSRSSIQIPEPPVLSGHARVMQALLQSRKKADSQSSTNSSVSSSPPRTPNAASLSRRNSYFDLSKPRTSLDDLSEDLKLLGIHIDRLNPLHSSRSRHSISLTPIGNDLRARAVSEGLPPLVAMATQLSTRVMGNIVAYRGSGPIPPGLYHAVFTRGAHPKPVTEKAKSSTIGPQTGYAVQDPRNGRYERNKDGQYYIRPDQPPSLEGRPLEVSLRNIFNDMGERYALYGDRNPDIHGVLRFHQIDHPYDPIKDIIYSVNIHKGKKIDPETLKNYKLVSSHFDHLGNKPDEASIFHDMDLDVLCPVSVQHPEDSMPQPLIVLGGIVRDCDIDTMTDPPLFCMENMLGKEEVSGDFENFLKPLDMTPHGYIDAQGVEQPPEMEELIRAHEAVALMVEYISKINNLRWQQYGNVKEEARVKIGEAFDEARWSGENVDKKPFVRKHLTPEMLSVMVVTVGKGTPMQLYQGLEINVIEQKIRASKLDPQKDQINVADFDSDNPAIRNAALSVLHAQQIPYNKETIATSFIQHPAECHNEYYTCPRGPVVVISGKTIFIDDDQKLSDYILSNNQYQPINPQWVTPDSLGSENAKVWVKHFLAGYDQHYKNDPDMKAVKKKVDSYLRNSDTKGFFLELLKDFMVYPGKKGNASSRRYLETFHDMLFRETKLIAGSDFQMRYIENSAVAAGSRNSMSP